ncbi:rhomboid family intramembrane serine protease [Rhodobacteraceae bacterium HSP-20]|uniref:Rhomboid family intramembrane serine protease n=1 Tax=Paragemmobacter amnigenus TaxID=2852097 RepID=A0ABS6IZP1_9RHOB|nr:rhomboid family intramembrane serine protease [Rhodobacter amnigenus]MBU9696813.1 rhomboid family intramembrane serine protease [Rhodobacter amnigenus]MBV4388040.1 rhomboid family intramembrane serine protease [Rhodobacter amnigenus]
MFPIRDHNPSGRRPIVTLCLIGANVLIFVAYWLGLPSEEALGRFFMEFGLVPARISYGEGYWTFVSSMFLHGGWMHLLGNMLFLHIFGDNLEEEMGHLPYLGFYLLSGFGAAVLQYLAEPQSMVPMVGASGAIAGVMGGYLLLFPKARVDVFFFFVVFFRIIPIPAWIVLGIWFAIQLGSGWMTPADMGGVAYWAHVGGFVAGLAASVPLWLRRGGTGFWSRTHGAPPHPEAEYRMVRTSVPRVRRGGRGPWG